MFLPKNSDGQKVGAQAETDADGQFSLSTFKGKDYRTGIAPGEYIVTVTKLEVIQDMRRQPKNLLPQKYSQVSTTDLAASVSDDRENAFSFELEK